MAIRTYGEGVILTDEFQLAEIALAGDATELAEDDEGLIWKEALKTGVCATTPGANQKPTFKPLVVKLDTDEPREISLQKLVSHFESGAVEHVTVPLSHADRVDENTGYVRKLRIEPDPSRPGEHRLMAGYHFTEPDIKGKVKRGTIANNSVGVLFDHVRKMDGKRFNQVLAHIALTNRPWIGGLQPFGVNASDLIEESEVAYFSQDDALLGSGASLAKTEEKDNWVDHTGELPRYVREVARSLHRDGMSMSRAIATAISRIKKWAVSSTDPKVKAKATKATAQWEALKGRAAAKRKADLSDDEFVEGINLGDDALAYTEADFADREEMTSLSLAEARDQRDLEWEAITHSPVRKESVMTELDPQEMAAELERLREQNSALMAERRRDEVIDKVTSLSEDWGDHPNFLGTVRDILLSDDGGTALLLSEYDDAGAATSSDPKKMTATEIVDRLIGAMPKPQVHLSEQAHQTTTAKPKVDATDEVIPHEDQVAAAREWLAGKPLDELKKEA